nr:hypothetical protein [Tanacetum cinerariifolium]
QPEGDVGAAGLALRIGHVPAHRDREDDQPTDQQQRPGKAINRRPRRMGKADRDPDGGNRAGGDGDRHHEPAPVQ